MIPFGYGSPMRVEQRSSAHGARLDWSPLWCLVWACVRACHRSALALGEVIRTGSHDGIERHRASSWGRGFGEVSGLFPVPVPVVSVFPPCPIPRGSGTVGWLWNGNGTRGHVFAEVPAMCWRDRRALSQRFVIPARLPR